MLLKLIPNRVKVWLIKHLYADVAGMGDGGDTELAHVNLKEVALLKAHGGAGTINPRTGLVEFKGKGGGGSPAPQENTTYSSDLPEYAKPFYEELLKQSGKETYTTDAAGNVTGVKTPDPYTGGRLEEFTADQTAVQAGLRGMAPRSEFRESITDTETLTGLGTGAAASGLAAAGAYAPGSLASLGMATPAEFDAAAATKYMSPYEDAVTSAAIKEARRQGDIAKNRASMQSIGRGTFGGGREALVMGEADAQTNALIADLRAQGRDKAFNQAQQQFQRDRTAAMGAEEATLKAEMDRRQLGQQAEQFGAGLQKDVGLAGLQYGLAGAGQQADITGADQRAQLELMQAQAASGAEQQAMGQERRNLAYQEFMEQQDAAKRALEFQSNILRGTAGALGSTQTQYTPAPSLASQITGMGIAGLGLYNALSQGKIMIEELKESVQEEGLASIMPQGGNAMTSIENATNPGMPVANIVEQQETARNLSESQLIELAKSPDPALIPPYLVTGELMRRKSIREKQAKAPQFTVAEEVVQQAEQGIMGQMQQMAPNMPPGGAAPMREEVTREQIMAKGLPQLPNPGPARPTMTGFAEGGIVHFQQGGNRGLYFPNPRLTSNVQSIKPRSGGRPTGEPTYQLVSMSGEPLISPYGDGSRDINETITNKINVAGKNRRPIMTDDPIQIERASLAETLKAINEGDTTYESIVEAKKIEDKIAALDGSQDGYEYTDEETLRLSQPDVLGGSEDNSISIDESIKVAGNEPDLTGLPDFTGLAGEIKGGSTFPPPSPYTRLKPGEEAQAAEDYFIKALGTNPAQAELLAYIKDKEAKTTERLAKDRKMNIASSLLKASQPFFEAGPYGSKVGSAIATGGQNYIEGEKRITKEAESFEDKMFALKQAERQAARAEKIATSKFGANSYQSAQAYNRKVEIQEQQDVLKAQQIQATKDLKDAQMRSTLALAKFQRQIGRDNKDDAAKIGEIKRKIEDKVRKKPGDFGLDYTSRSLIGFDENKEKDPDLKARIIAAKKKFNDIVAKKILEDEEIRALQGKYSSESNVIEYSSLR